ncbi:hypothetical protein TNCV_1022021 [Trichonephila clavipes]|nr:hypothetical protein TNCV_1022021 [Trichonephila clavipes]
MLMLISPIKELNHLQTVDASEKCHAPKGGTFEAQQEEGRVYSYFWLYYSTTELYEQLVTRQLDKFRSCSHGHKLVTILVSVESPLKTRYAHELGLAESVETQNPKFSMFHKSGDLL